MILSISAVDPVIDHIADWELRFTATAQHHKRLL